MSWTMFLSLYLCLFSSNALERHEFHISRTEIHYKSDQQAIQVSTHIFIDDFELALSADGLSDAALFMNTESENADQAIEAYANQNLVIQVDDTPIQLVFLGKEMSEDLTAAWCYFEQSDVPSFSDFMIKNDLLNQVYDDQKNITIVKIDGKRAAHWIFDKEYTIDQYQIK